MKQLLRQVTGPKSIIITVNAGGADDHWTQDINIGGGVLVRLPFH